jgi:ornithine cyclodeaminase
LLIISGEDQRKALSIKEAIETVAIALGEFSKGKANTPIRTAIPIEKEEATALFMPSYVEAANSLGVKFVSVFPKNNEMNKKTIYGVMMLADVRTGEPLALLEASYLTVLRTGAASGLATRYLAKANSTKLAVIGTGAQATGLIKAVRTDRPIEEITLFNRTRNKAEALKAELMSESPAVKVTVCDGSDKAVTGADIIVTATDSKEPVLSSGAVAKGAHVNAVGSFRPSMQELPSNLVVRADKIVVESREAALEETGDLMIPIKEGLLSSNGIYAELGELALKEKMGRENDQEITIFKSIGLAAMDVVIAKAIYDRVLSLKLGKKISF